MEKYKNVEIDETIRKELDKHNMFTFEMTSWESGFLTGLLKEKKPKKILEIGVAEGATSVLIKKVMERIGNNDFSMYSVELSEKLYSDNTLMSGYQFRDACEKGIITDENYTLFLGKYLPEVIDLVGNDIDFVVLDTVHCSPGELLDLLIVLPYMKKGGTLCFHDIALDYNTEQEQSSYYINKLLFDVANSNYKYLNIKGNLDNNRNMGFPNIGAFSIEQSIFDSIHDLFSCFTFPWVYMPSNNELDIYEKKYEEIYSKDLVDIFRFAKQLNIKKHNSKSKNDIEKELILKIIKEKNIFLYGTGLRAKKIFTYLNSLHAKISGFIVSDGYKEVNEFMGLPIIKLSEYNASNDTIIVLATSFNETIQMLNDMELEYLVPSDSFLNKINYYYYIVENM